MVKAETRGDARTCSYSPIVAEMGKVGKKVAGSVKIVRITYCERTEKKG